MPQVVQLKKSFDRSGMALRGIDLELRPGEFIAVIGGSGSGKTTLLRCLAMKERWDSGKLIYQGKELIRGSWWTRWRMKKDWTVLDQTPNLLEKRTAYRNVLRGRFRDFPLWRLLIGGKASEDEHVRALDYLEQFGLLDKAFMKVETLSGGEKQRVAIARSLCQGAKIIIADDPVSNLDPHSADQVMSDLQKVCKRDGLIVVCVFRSAEYAEKYANRYIGLDDGRIIFDVKGRRLTAAEKMKI